MSQSIQIIGCGDIGKRVAKLALQKGLNVQAWVKSKRSQNICQQMGLIARCIDFDKPYKINFGQNCSILYTVPPTPHGVEDARLPNLLASLKPQYIDKFVLISTTGVYGDHQGAWIDENSALRPIAERAQRRLHAENCLQAWAKKYDVATLILRVPGIYAQDRLPLKRLQAGTPILARTLAPWTNRIHADDLAAACLAALIKPIKNEIINIIDDAPSSMTDYFFAVADYAQLPRPAEINLDTAKQQLSAGMLSYLLESRRIKNDKMKALLKTKLQYPSLEVALSRFR